MTYKEFVSWCNDRACDGCWGLGTALFCIDLVQRINRLPFWSRKKEWEKSKDCAEQIVSSTEDMMERVMNDGKPKIRN